MGGLFSATSPSGEKKEWVCPVQDMYCYHCCGKEIEAFVDCRSFLFGNPYYKYWEYIRCPTCQVMYYIDKTTFKAHKLHSINVTLDKSKED